MTLATARSPASAESVDKHIVDALTEAGIRHLAVLPESWLAPLLRRIEGSNRFTTIAVTREDEGVGVCVGLALGGLKSALLMQNTGLLASANAIVTVPLKHRIPLL